MHYRSLEITQRTALNVGAHIGWLPTEHPTIIQSMVEGKLLLHFRGLENAVITIGRNGAGREPPVNDLITKLEREVRVEEKGHILLQGSLPLISDLFKALHCVFVLQRIVKIAVDKRQIGKQALAEQMVPAEGSSRIAPVHLKGIVKLPDVPAAVG